MPDFERIRLQLTVGDTHHAAALFAQVMPDTQLWRSLTPEPARNSTDSTDSRLNTVTSLTRYETSTIRLHFFLARRAQRRTVASASAPYTDIPPIPPNATARRIVLVVVVELLLPQ